MPRAFAIAAHPDDIEFLMAGTLILLRDRGYEIHYLNVANGCCGTTEYDASTIAQIRRQEAENAAHSIGAIFHPSLCADLEIFYEPATLRKLAAVVREVQPDILLTHSLTDYMEDHTNTARLAVTAAFARGMPNFVTKPATQPVETSVTIYHAQPYSHRDPLGKLVLPDYFVDVSGVLSAKSQMLAKHVSQKTWLDESQGLDSYLTTQRELDAELGAHSGRFSHAEGWRRHLHLGFCGPDDDPLAAALGDQLVRRDAAG